jgi:hypothetical protein
MKIPFSSFSPFVQSVFSKIETGKFDSDPKLSIVITSRPSSLMDLFALGRLLSLIRQLQNSLGIEIEFIFPHHMNLWNLRSLGFFEYCQTNNIRYELAPRAQLELFTNPNPESESKAPSQMRKNYWQCLIPLQRHGFDIAKDEQHVVSNVNKFTDIFAAQIYTALEEREVDPKDVSSELSRILLSMVRELLSNTITHSNESEFLFAMTLSRETGTETRPHRPGITLPPGQDKFEVLLMDFGQGIYPSVLRTLASGEVSQVNSDYFNLKRWHDSHRLDKTKEESLLTNVFRGDFVIRKGRKSEGLYELGQTLSWFGGMLNIFSGRTEMQISAATSEELSITPRFNKRPFYLPGVITSFILPSQQIKAASIKSFARHNPTNLSEGQHKRSCEILRFKNVPSGFFGGVSIGKIRRRSELEAAFVITEYERAKGKKVEKPFFWDINLRMSDNIDINFIDSFIQELCKRIDEIEPKHSRNFFKLIFTNVPRNVIRALEKRNCKSFLMLKNTFCLFLDEADDPHFFGVPRASNRLFDIEDALRLIFHAGVRTQRDLTDRLGMAAQATDHLQRLLQTNEDSVFSCYLNDEGAVFECHNVVEALKHLRCSNLQDLDKVRLREPKGAIIKLRNGTYVDSIFDFCLFWSDNEKLTDCAKLLLSVSGFPLVDTILSFMNNGDRLASAIQRFTKTPNLIIIDPHNPRTWNNIEVNGNCILIIDALYPGDSEGGYIKEFIELTQGMNKNVNINWVYASCDFRNDDEEFVSEAQQEEQSEVSRLIAGLPVFSVPYRRT